MRDRALTDPTLIQVLACPALEIESLAGIGQLTNLRFLDVAGNQLQSLDGISRLSSLSSVNAPGNRLQDISALLEVTALSSAALTGNNLIPCVQLETLSARLGGNLLRPETCFN
jgi:internalin A